MGQANAVQENVEDLDALFDSIVQQRTHAEPVPPEGVAAVSPDDQGVAPDPAGKLLNQVGQITRKLHENLRDLGYDKLLAQSASAIPDVRDRLTYVVTMTHQAAERVLNATDVAKPIQEQLATRSGELASRWDQLLAQQLTLEQFRALVDHTRAYLADVPGQAEATQAQLMEIMMAQDFQDLTGQVIKQIVDIVQDVESQLLTVLLEHTPQDRRTDSGSSMMNGPVVNGTGRNDVVVSQVQVDDLLESLGF